MRPDRAGFVVKLNVKRWAKEQHIAREVAAMLLGEVPCKNVRIKTVKNTPSKWTFRCTNCNVIFTAKGSTLEELRKGRWKRANEST